MSNHCSQTVLPTLPHLSFVPVHFENHKKKLPIPLSVIPSPTGTQFIAQKPFGGFTDRFPGILPALCSTRRSHAPSEQCATAEVESTQRLDDE